MASNYPPGVTGNEYEIAGPDWEEEVHEQCPQCYRLGTLTEYGYRGMCWIECCECGYQGDEYEPA